MKYQAVQKYVRMTPRKLRLVAGMVRELTPAEAVEMLPYATKRAAKPLEKVIKAAIANAKQSGAKEEELVFEEIHITEGPRLKRGKPVARGRWHPVLKRWSHIRVILNDQSSKKKQKVVKKKSTTPGKRKSAKTVRKESKKK